MNTFKNYVSSVGISFILVLLLGFILAVLNYFDILNIRFYKVLLLFFIVISISFGSYYLGYNSSSKGYFNGFIFGVLIDFIFLSISLFIGNSFSFSTFIYYLLIVVVAVISSTIGINKKTTDE